jgi:hypothetical protein
LEYSIQAWERQWWRAIDRRESAISSEVGYETTVSKKIAGEGRRGERERCRIINEEEEEERGEAKSRGKKKRTMGEKKREVGSFLCLVQAKGKARAIRGEGQGRQAEQGRCTPGRRRTGQRWCVRLGTD